MQVAKRNGDDVSMDFLQRGCLPTENFVGGGFFLVAEPGGADQAVFSGGLVTHFTRKLATCCVSQG